MTLFSWLKSNFDIWFNGYLGVFFNFKMFGVLNWIAIPLLIYFLYTLKKREKWQIATVFVIAAGCIFICVQGYSNFRYQLTLHPLLLTLIFLTAWEIARRIHKKVIIAMAICFFFVSVVFARPLFDKCLSVGEKYIVSGNIENLYPTKVINFIEEKVILDEDCVILECNQPLLYYHTTKKGLSYTDIRVKKFYRNWTDKEKAFQILWDELKVRYILSEGPLDKRFKDVSRDVVCKGKRLYVYKVREKQREDEM